MNTTTDNTTPATIGKLEWMTIIVWTIILLSSSLIISIACRKSLDNIFSVSDSKYTSCVTTFAIMGIVAFTYLQLETIIQFAVSPIFTNIVGGIQALFITLIIIAHIVINKKNKNKTANTELANPTHSEKQLC